MIRVYSPRNEGELAIIRSILTSEGIFHFVHNDHFGSLKIGPRIDLYNKKTIMVEKKHFKMARELIYDYLQCTKKEINKKTFRSEYSLFDKIRVIIEFFIFGWIIPGKKYIRKKPI